MSLPGSVLDGRDLPTPQEGGRGGCDDGAKGRMGLPFLEGAIRMAEGAPAVLRRLTVARAVPARAPVAASRDPVSRVPYSLVSDQRIRLGSL